MKLIYRTNFEIELNKLNEYIKSRKLNLIENKLLLMELYNFLCKTGKE